MGKKQLARQKDKISTIELDEGSAFDVLARWRELKPEVQARFWNFCHSFGIRSPENASAHDRFKLYGPPAKVLNHKVFEASRQISSDLLVGLDSELRSFLESLPGLEATLSYNDFIKGLITATRGPMN